MNVDISQRLYDHLSAKGDVEVLLASDESGMDARLESYLNKNKEEILEFYNDKKNTMNELVEKGKVYTYENVSHNPARPEVVQKLYEINKFANDNDFDMVIHVHFNDYPGRSRDKVYKYNGFSIYAPERQFSNYEASKLLGEKIKINYRYFSP